jgi:ferrous iron transport protein B
MSCNLFLPHWFNWQICIALIPAMAAREVVGCCFGYGLCLVCADDDAVLKVYRI